MEAIEAIPVRSEKKSKRDGWSDKLCKDRYRSYPFNPEVAARICEEVTKGKTVEKIGQIKGFPPSWQIRAWCRYEQGFKEAMQEARKDRSEYFHDKVIEEAEACKLKSKVGPAKVKIDAYKWAAEKGDPQNYGRKTVVEGNEDRPVRIIVDTGIRRDAIEFDSRSGERIESKGKLHDQSTDRPEGEGEKEGSVPVEPEVLLRDETGSDGERCQKN